MTVLSMLAFLLETKKTCTFQTPNISSVMIEERLTEHREKLRKTLPAVLLKDLHAQFRALLKYIDSYEEAAGELMTQLRNAKNPAESKNFLAGHIEHRKKNLELLNSWVSKRQKISPGFVFNGYDEKFTEILGDLPTYWECKQSEERFHKATGDNKLIKAIKIIKKYTYSTQLFFHRVSNWIRAKTGRKTKEKPLWNQKIPVRKLTALCYENRLLMHFSVLSDDKMKEVAMLAREIWRADDALFCKLRALSEKSISIKDLLAYYEAEFLPVIHQTRSVVTGHKESLRPLLMEAWKDMDHAFSAMVRVAGTLEMPGFIFPNIWLRHRRSRLRSEHVWQTRRRTNTLFALADDWKFNQEIYTLTVSALKIKALFKQSMQERSKFVKKSMQTVASFFNNSRENMGSASLPELNKKLQHLKYAAGKDLHNTIIPEVIKVLQNNAFPELVTETKNELLEVLSSKTRKRILIKGFDPARAYSDKSLETISLLELLEFDIAGKLEKAIYQIRLRSLKELDDFRGRLKDLGRMALFNIDSAMLMAEKQENANPDEIAAEARAGIQRAIDRHAELFDAFDQFVQKIQTEFDEIIAEFNNGLLALTDNSKVDTIRYRIIKTRALKKREHFYTTVKRRGQKAWHKTKRHFRFINKNIRGNLHKIRSQLGIQEHSKDISVEISDFLANDHEKLKKIPFVYRRLFVNEPLTDTAFFHPRREAKNALASAYQKWKGASFTATLIYGEKGSGISSFVHMFFKENLDGELEKFLFLPNNRILTEKDLLAQLGISLQNKAFTSYDDFIQFVEKKAPFVLFVDKLHMLYLRQPAGFQLLKRLLEIISNTSKQVFWVCSCGLYAANFLDKSIGLFGYFPQLIRMRSLETEKVRNIIMLRHNASGYKLHFLPSAEDLAQKNFTRKSPEEQQAILKEKFFTGINKLSQSNISFALQLWLHSTGKVEDSTVYLNSLDSLDLSFIYNLPDEVVFALHALVLHELLDEEKLAEIMNIGKAQAYMMLMRLKDRGIVVQQYGTFGIHPLLYRQSLALLHDKNLVH